MIGTAKDVKKVHFGVGSSRVALFFSARMVELYEATKIA
jgi:hypothetical protein